MSRVLSAKDIREAINVWGRNRWLYHGDPDWRERAEQDWKSIDATLAALQAVVVAAREAKREIERVWNTGDSYSAALSYAHRKLGVPLSALPQEETAAAP